MIGTFRFSMQRVDAFDSSLSFIFSQPQMNELADLVICDKKLLSRDDR